MPPAPPGAFWEQNYRLQVWCAEGRSLGLMVVQFLELSQNPSALLANKILIRRKKKIKCYGQPLRCCPLFCSQKRPDLKAQCSENRWRARYFSGHCFKGAVVEDQAAILVATCVGESFPWAHGKGLEPRREGGGGPSPLAKCQPVAKSKWAVLNPE